MVDSDNHYLYYVMNDGKAIRYGITVGEEAMAWSGIAKIGSMTEWPAWHPTKGEIERLGVPTFVPPGPDNPMGSRAMYLYSGGKDTLFRIHGTNQPEYIGQSISSGCIRMTNEDVIDLYNRVKIGTIVVVLAPHHGDIAVRYRRRWRSGRQQHRLVAVTRTDFDLTESKAPVYRRFFFGGCQQRVFAPPAPAAHWSHRHWVSSASGSSATWRGGASSGRAAGSIGATAGIASQTFHWQIR